MIIEIAESWGWSLPPKDETSFESMMTSLDKHLAAGGIAVPARQMIGAAVVSRVLGFSGTSLFPRPDDAREPWSPLDILGRVGDWFQHVYGQKLATDPSPGSTCVVLRGAVWEVRLPKLFGTLSLFTSRDLATRGVALGNVAPASSNALCAVVGLTQALANRLTGAEIAEIVSAYLQGFKATRTLARLPPDPLFQQALAHYRHSVSELLRREGPFGNARRETALCCEKVLKGILTRLDKPYPKRGRQAHDIKHLGALFSAAANASLPEEDLQEINCDADVSYLAAVSQHEALSAHAALRRTLSLLDPGGAPCEVRIAGTMATRSKRLWSLMENSSETG